MKDKLADVFDLDPIDTFDIYEDDKEFIKKEANIDITQLEETVVADTIDQDLIDAKEDFDDVRSLLKSLLEKGKSVLQTAELVATSSQAHKDIEAYFKGADSITKTARELLNSHKDMMGMKPVPEIVPQVADTINNNNIIFQGSTGDFIQMLREQKMLENQEKPE